MILLYHSYARDDWTEAKGLRSGKKSDYDILVITKNKSERDRLRDKVLLKSWPPDK